MSEEALAEARKLMYDQLMSPWLKMSPWSTTRICIYLEHPIIPNRDHCPCGKRRVETA